MRKVTISEKLPYRMYLPEELGRDGFAGETCLYANFDTATIVRKGVTLEDVKKSLELTLVDIKRRKEAQKNEIKKDDSDEQRN